MTFGECPEVQYQENFDMEAFSGQWYEQERDKIFTFEFNQECVTENFMATPEGDYSFYFRGQFWQMMNTYQGIGGKISCDNTNSSQTCDMNMATPMGNKSTTYDVIDTDYENYAVYYMCKNIFGSNMRMEWLNIMSRGHSLSDEHSSKAKTAIAAQLPDFDLSEYSMHKTKQGDTCDYDFTI